MTKRRMNFANILTMMRIVFIPLIVGCFYIDGNAAKWAAAIFYTLACVTDFFDGYVARHFNQISKLGRFLDPIADKLLIASLLLMLIAFDRISIYGTLPALVILCREILVSGLREHLAEIQVNVPVTNLAKWKTTAQMFSLPALILIGAVPEWMSFDVIGEGLLWIAAILTVVTGYDYMKIGMQHMND